MEEEVIGGAPNGVVSRGFRAWRWAVGTLLSLLSVFAALLVFYKPTRILLPRAFGVPCRERGICVDDPSRYDEALALLTEARLGLENRWGLSVGNPRAIFCATDRCGEAFGVSRKAGYTFGSLGIVIAPRGWHRHYVAHELVHHWQASNFGSLTLRTGEPWLIEGMAYVLSEDPREALPDPHESLRRKFREWLSRNQNAPLSRSFAEALQARDFQEAKSPPTAAPAPGGS